MKRLFILCLVMLSAACSGAASQNASSSAPTVESSVLSVSSFKATVKGAVNQVLSGTASYFKQNGGGFLITLVDTQSSSGATITIILPVGTTAGTYTPKSYEDAYDSTSNTITAIGASFTVLNTTKGIDTYALISEGTLNLQSLDPMTGSIDFKAKIEGGGEVEVTATFYQLIAI